MILVLRGQSFRKEHLPIYSVPIKGDGEIARNSNRVNRLFEKK